MRLGSGFWAQSSRFAYSLTLSMTEVSRVRSSMATIMNLKPLRHFSSAENLEAKQGKRLLHQPPDACMGCCETACCPLSDLRLMGKRRLLFPARTQVASCSAI